jgi:hypothetical protein
MNVPGFNARGSYASEMRRDGNFFGGTSASGKVRVDAIYSRFQNSLEFATPSFELDAQSS